MENTGMLENREVEKLGEAVIDEGYLSRKPAWVGGQISPNDATFLSGLVQTLQPRKVVEIGVASGWSSSILLRSLESRSLSYSVVGVDLCPDYYLDKTMRTGSVVEIMTPNLVGNYQLLTGNLAFEVMAEVGQADFAFIDAHHMHPWATFDLIAVTPFMKKGAWVALHDINLCRLERHKHMNRGPFYLYYLWPDTKLNSTQEPSMIGAIKFNKDPKEYLSAIFEILCTPWEVPIERATVERLGEYIGVHFGKEWAHRFSSICEIANVRPTAVPQAPSAPTSQLVQRKKWWRFSQRR